jgi:hypothetical protein
MNSVELLAQATKVAEQMGYQVRQEWLGGVNSGGCEFAGRKWIFLDLALNAAEQLDQLTEVLCQDPVVHLVSLPPPLSKLWGIGQVV